SIPIANLHTPPPTSPRRKLGSLLARSSSSPGATAATPRDTGAGAGGGRAGITSPPNMNHSHTNTNMRTTSRNTNHSRASNSRNTNHSRASSRSGSALPGGLRLHTGMGTGRGVGLGAGLPVSPLPAPSAGTGSASFLQKGFGLGLGLGMGQRFVSGTGTGTGSGFSPLRAASGAVARDEDGDGEGESPVRSLSQSWSDLAGEEVGEEMEGDDFVGRDSQRHSWDSVATVREEQQPGRHGRYYEQDDADDEGEGSNANTHIGEGSDGYKDGQEYGGFQGREGSREIEGSHEFAASPEYAGTRRYEDSGEYEREMRRGGDESRQEERGFQEYESDRQEDDRQSEEDIVGVRKGKDEDESRIDDRELQEQGNSDGTRDAEQHTAETQDTEGDTLPPGRVMLMERLCDLVQRLSSVRVGGGMEADVIDVLNAKVDEMEDLLVLAEETAEAEATADVEAQAEAEDQGDDHAEGQVADYAEAEANVGAEASDIEPSQEEDAGTEGDGQEEQVGEADRWASGMSPAMLPVPLLQVGDQDIRDLASPLPWLTSTFKYSELSISPTQSHPELAAATNEALEAAKQAAQAQHDMAERVAFEADKLNRELAEVVKKLQARKEESDHLHSLLIDRAEAAATRILDLEQEICDLEDDILANESELRHLRLKLRAVETVCHEWVGGDPELVRSIDNWKADWVLVRDRMLERKKDRKDRRLRLHRAGCVISSLEEREANEMTATTATTLTSLGGLSMSVSLLGLGRERSPRKGC
ncbi:hypothetical protein C8A01DRAFT_20792, partial [Parachaetomium inaequale]